MKSEKWFLQSGAHRCICRALYTQHLQKKSLQPPPHTWKVATNCPCSLLRKRHRLEILIAALMLNFPEILTMQGCGCGLRRGKGLWHFREGNDFPKFVLPASFGSQPQLHSKSTVLWSECGFIQGYRVGDANPATSPHVKHLLTFNKN